MDEKESRETPMQTVIVMIDYIVTDLQEMRKALEQLEQELRNDKVDSAG